MKKNKKLILLEMNEINFDIVKEYISRGEKLNNFKSIIEGNFLNTHSEEEHELLEPWIQWPSIHIGKNFAEHKIFRLGDIVNSDEKQIFEVLENDGYKVGAVSPMNCKNELKNPLFFIPDPWTKTLSDKSFGSRAISKVINQAVNDNAKSLITFKTFLNLFMAILILVSPKSYIKLLIFGFSALRKPWRKSLFLDILLSEIHLKFLKTKKPDFSTLFINAGAHIQHHYFFNSIINKSENKNPDWYIADKEDPVLEMLYIYDDIVGSLLKNKFYQLIIATGLSQKPHEHITFYYRLSNYERFLEKFSIHFKEVYPRMSRDFLVSFDSNEDAKVCELKLKSFLFENGDKLFSEIQNRGKELFVSLTYSKEIKKDTKCYFNNMHFYIYEYVDFVAIKNGEHQSKGYAYFSDGFDEFSLKEDINICVINNLILTFFASNSLK
tara:strand:+ start:21220 stop:22533 length:1314 start_codon:yes stop_codon:yes gene_type:complete